MKIIYFIGLVLAILAVIDIIKKSGNIIKRAVTK